MSLYAFEEHAPRIDPSAYVAENATVIGNVTVSARASIWFGAVVRGDGPDPIVIGEGSNVQDNAVLHSDPGFALTIGADVTVGHLVMLHGCTIGDGSLIGIGAIVLNGARIGRRCIVGAGALVTEGKTFDDGSLIVGSPARAVRTLDDAAFDMLRRSAGAYTDRTVRYAGGLRRIG